MRRWIVLLLLAGCAAPPQAPPRLTVEALYSDPPLASALPAEVAWTPKSKLSYVEKKKLWTFDPETGAREVALDLAAVPDPPAIGRAEPRRCLWSPSGDAILIHREDLTVFTAGRFVKLIKAATALGDPKWSPDGAWVSFIRDHDLWAVPSAGGDEVRLTEGGNETLLNGELDWVYPEELGIDTGYWWSADSKRVAFLQLDQSRVTEFPLVDYPAAEGRVQKMRYPKAGGANPVPKVGIRTLGGDVRWAVLPPDTEYVARVQWAGDRLILQTLNRRQDRLTLSDAEGSVLYSEESKTWVEQVDDLSFVDGRMSFISDRSGFGHIYVDGRQVTEGDWNVRRILSGGEPLYFVGSRESPQERHVYRLSAGRLDRMTSGPGSFDASMSPDRRWLLVTGSTWTRPPRMEVMRADGTGVRLFAESTISLPVVEPEVIRVPAADGTPLEALLFRPRGGGRRPLVVHTYGGPGSPVVVNRWNGRSFLWHQLLLERGFAVALVDNRASRGAGAMRAIHRRLGEIEVADLESAVRHLKTLTVVDPERVGLWGWSYGGYMACLALTRTREFRAAIAVAPVTHWSLYDTIYTERYMQRPQDNPEGYRLSAPLTHAANLHGRLLIAHGLADDNVHWQNTERFIGELIRARKWCDLMTYPGQSHGISDRDARVHLFSGMTEFFERELKR